MGWWRGNPLTGADTPGSLTSGDAVLLGVWNMLDTITEPRNQDTLVYQDTLV